MSRSLVVDATSVLLYVFMSLHSASGEFLYARLGSSALLRIGCWNHKITVPHT